MTPQTLLEQQVNANGMNKNPLLVCRYCFDKKFEIPCSGGRVNVRQKMEQKESSKRKSFGDNVAMGRRKGRKS